VTRRSLLAVLTFLALPNPSPALSKKKKPSPARPPSPTPLRVPWRRMRTHGGLGPSWTWTRRYSKTQMRRKHRAAPRCSCWNTGGLRRDCNERQSSGCGCRCVRGGHACSSGIASPLPVVVLVPLFDKMPQRDALSWAPSCWFIVRPACPVYHWNHASSFPWPAARCFWHQVWGSASGIGSEI
jgi:hypothetical protein